MHLDETLGVMLLAISSRIQYNHKVNQSNLDELMYDDYDLEYSYTPEYTYDLDETYDMWVQSYNALDEDVQQDDEYARDNDTYEALAYRHYAWYNTHVYITHLATRHMYTPTKRLVSVTLDVECYDDLPLEDMDWKEVLGLEGDENVHVNIKELADIYWLCQFVDWFLLIFHSQ